MFILYLLRSLEAMPRNGSSFVGKLTGPKQSASAFIRLGCSVGQDWTSGWTLYMILL